MSYNPYLNYSQMYQNNQMYQTTPFSTQQPQHYEVIRVSGRGGAEALPMSPNGSVIVADNNKADRLWFCVTDGAGFKTVRAIKYEFEDDMQPDSQLTQNFANLEDRLTKLEGIVNGLNNRNAQSRKNNAEHRSD